MVAQEKASDDPSFVDPKTKKTTVTEPKSKRPGLRVADNGRVAVEDSDLSTRQAKVFYAEPGVVKESNARLLETGSKYQLFTDAAGVVKAPGKDGPPLHVLDRVLPRDLTTFDASDDTYGNEGLTMQVEATCDEVAQLIVGTGNIGDFPVLKKSIDTVIGFGELNVARYLMARRMGKSPDEAVVVANNALNLGPEHDAELKTRTDDTLADKEAKGEFDNAKGDAETAEIIKRNKARLVGGVRVEMEKELKAEISDAYGKLLASRPKLVHQLSDELGLNRMAQPEVGQAFGSIQMRAKDKRDWKTGKHRTEEEGGTWGSHYGAVVAKSGGDSVTLENYARARENQGISDATTQMYYFQMYGSEVGQTWHETWANTSRRVVNPLTQVMGKSYAELWSAQLAGVPRAKNVTDDIAYPEMLAKAQAAVRNAANRDAAMDDYRRGLLNLVANRVVCYASIASDIGVEAGLMHWTDNFPLGSAAVKQIDEWLASGATLKGSAKTRWPVRAAALSQVRDAMVLARRYYCNRFPADDLARSDATDKVLPKTAGKPLKAKEQAKVDDKLKQYLVELREDVAKHEELKKRGGHYEGEDVDASTNPAISDGRKAVAGLRLQGMSDDAIFAEFKKIFPSYSRAEVNTYFLATDTTPKVAYLDSTDRADYELKVSGSKFKQRNKDFDTGEMFSSGAGAGYSIFVMSPRGELYANEHKPVLFHHSSFLAGLPTSAAGELKVKKGVLQHVTNKSGHYHPGAAQTYQAMLELKSRGLTLSSFKLKIAGIPDDSPESKFNTDYPSARVFADEYAEAKH
ncbi:MAG: hypothetical protein ACRDZ8_03830 [Acidimicrobiales bacterium]